MPHRCSRYPGAIRLQRLRNGGALVTDELRDRVRDAVMGTFRAWGGQWNVTPAEPGVDDVPADRWEIKVRSHPIVMGYVSADVVRAYLERPTDPQAQADWESQLRPLFEEARAQAP